MNKKKLFKKKFETLDLNFSYENFNEKYIPKIYKVQHNLSNPKINIINQNRYKFILNNDSYIFNNYSTSINHYFSFDEHYNDIKFVISLNSNNTKCPICLESKILVPIILYCGHIFCYPCFIQYKIYYLDKYDILKCPICNEKINIIEYKEKFCEIKKIQNYNINSNICFNLVLREKKNTNIYNISNDYDLKLFKKYYYKDIFNIPFEENNFFYFSKIFYSNKQLMNERYKNFILDLKKGKKEEIEFYNEQEKIKILDNCIETIEEIIILNDNEIDYLNLINNKEDELNNDDNFDNNKNKKNNNFNYDKFYFFYQENNSDIYYLNPKIFEILLFEYGGIEYLPVNLEGKILDIEIYQVTKNFIKKYSFLNHLNIDCIIFFVNIDIEEYISDKTKLKFKNYFETEKNFRKAIEYEEKKYNKFINENLNNNIKNNNIYNKDNNYNIDININKNINYNEYDFEYNNNENILNQNDKIEMIIKEESIDNNNIINKNENKLDKIFDEMEILSEKKIKKRKKLIEKINKSTFKKENSIIKKVNNKNINNIKKNINNIIKNNNNNLNKKENKIENKNNNNINKNNNNLNNDENIIENKINTYNNKNINNNNNEKQLKINKKLEKKISKEISLKFYFFNSILIFLILYIIKKLLFFSK